VGANSQDELLAQAKEAIEGSDIEKLIALHHFQDAPQSFLSSTREQMKQIVEASKDVKAIELGDPAEVPKECPPIPLEGSLYEPSVKLSGFVKITYQSSPRVNRIFFGLAGKQYVFMGLKRLDKAETADRFRLQLVAKGSEMIVQVNGQVVPVPGVNSSLEQDIVPYIKKGANELQVDWKSPEGAELVSAPEVSLRRLDAAGKEIWDKTFPLEGMAGSKKFDFSTDS
jgi:hypothetical protein